MVTRGARCAIVDAMTRKAATDYAGPRSSVPFDKLEQLATTHALQEKRDGEYVRVHLDASGRIARLFSRSGAIVSDELAGDVLGALVGMPNAELVGELEAHTEAGRRAAKKRGHAVVHLFDAIRDGGQYLARAPYRERYRALQVMQEWAAGELERGRFRGGHRTRDMKKGSYSPDVLGPAGLRRAPILPCLTLEQARQVWERARCDEAEGLVAAALEAPLGARLAKVKCKPSDTLDCQVVSYDGKGFATLRAGTMQFAVSARGRSGEGLAPGVWVEVKFNGWMKSSNRPKFARIVRRRPDLSATL